MTNEEIIQKIKSNHKTLVAYYPYPTGGNGVSNEIAETDNFNGRKYDEDLKNLVNLMVQLGASVAGYRADNKTAVQLEVDGIDFPVYCYMYDGGFHITKQVWSEPGAQKIHWVIGC